MEEKNKMEEEEAKKIVESITDSITSGEKKDIEESTRDIVKKAALAVGSLKETEFDIRYVIFINLYRECCGGFSTGIDSRTHIIYNI